MSAPVLILSQWAKNQREVVRVALEEFNGKPIVNIRTWYRPEGGDDLRPGKSGIAMSVQHLPALAAAINGALGVATERGDIVEQERADG
ncbi:transcriptional coactivator p15/PC4 family protein [Bosea sp. PAMC 26642]|uniref:transcriptional coactivator p15/PC4 family protein n=1 Tax=Bosea sp. (strain PAMC 26642) TaxID=1792307 RepID=UPI0007700CBF|nr:transcriptional coactivator p15/PC4 family protein [Bosea sp. PAMC 26642]AMJ61973.1 hypothetical protein AXW83_18205 [Bosea sp. PAMC 26642]